MSEDIEDKFLPCKLCNGGETRVDGSFMSPRMDGSSALISVTIYHWCQNTLDSDTYPRQSITVRVRDYKQALEVWNHYNKK